MNVTYEHLNTDDVAKTLGVSKCTVTMWCRNGHIKYTNVSDGNKKPRYMYDEKEVERVMDLMAKYGKRDWIAHSKAIEKQAQAETHDITTVSISEDMGDDELISTVQKYRALKKQLEELDNEREKIKDALNTLKEKVLEEL